MWWPYDRMLWEARFDRLAAYLKNLQIRTRKGDEP